MLLDLGNYVESHMIKWFRKAKKWFDLKYYQQSVQLFTLIHPLTGETILIEGSTDSVFWNDKWKGVIDYKSKKDKFHSYMKTDWDATTEKLSRLATQVNDRTFWVEDLPRFVRELNDPFFADNFYQLNTYCMSPFMVDRGIDHGAIIQYNKNDSRRREIRFKPSPELMEEVREKFQTVLTNTLTKGADTVPKSFALGSIVCGFCPYAKNCWSEDAQKAFFKSLPRKTWPEDIDAYDEGPEIASLLEELEVSRAAALKANKLEQEVALKLQNLGIKKVRINKEHIYMLKELKTKLAVRRTKL